MAAYASASVVFGTNFLNTLMAALKTTASGPLVATAKVRLNTNPAFNPQPGDSIATNTANEADFSGYTTGGDSLTISNPVNLSATCQGVVGAVTFTSATASPFVSGTAYGYWVDDGTNVIVAERFANGVNFGFSAPGDFLELIVQIPAQAFQATV
jgi:hypothetical protein